MMVRCGACRTQFYVPGAGRFTCPICGSVNSARANAGAPAPGASRFSEEVEASDPLCLIMAGSVRTRISKSVFKDTCSR